MIHTALEYTVAEGMTLTDWVPRCSGKIDSYVSISQFPDKTGSTVRKRKWTDKDTEQMEISEACWYSQKQSHHYFRKKILAKYIARKGQAIKLIAVGRTEKKKIT